MQVANVALGADELLALQKARADSHEGMNNDHAGLVPRRARAEFLEKRRLKGQRLIHQGATEREQSGFGVRAPSKMA